MKKLKNNMPQLARKLRRTNLILLGILFWDFGSVFAQKTIEINLCCETMKQPGNALLQYSFVYKRDTFIIPKIGASKYLSPLEYYNLAEYDPQDTSKVIFMIENNASIYFVKVRVKALFCPSIKLCIEHSGKKANYVFSYTDCNSITNFEDIFRLKKRKIDCIKNPWE